MGNGSGGNIVCKSFLLFSHSVMSNSLQPHGLQHARLSYPSLSPKVCSDSVHSVGDTIQPSHPLLPSPSPAFSRSQHQGLFHSVRSSHQCSKHYSFSISMSPFNRYSGFISFMTDWFDLLAFQGTLKCLLQHHSSKASILWQSAFFMVQLSHPYTTPGKTIALTRQTFVGKVIFLLFNTLHLS